MNHSPFREEVDWFNRHENHGDGPHIMRVTVLDEKIPETAWKTLHAFPNLNLEGKTHIIYILRIRSNGLKLLPLALWAKSVLKTA